MEYAVVFVFGIGFGMLIAFLIQIVGSHIAEKKKIENKEQMDPANWWKFGGNPFQEYED